MMVKINLPNNWKPRHYQTPLWRYLEHGGKRAIEIAHRRWGKDDVGLNWTAVSAFEKPATYWHMLPLATQARKAIWEAVNPHSGIRRIDEAFPKEIRSNTRENEMSIRFRSGSTWQVVGSDNYDSLVGSPPYGVILSEWALSDPKAWAYLRPILAENGGWAIFITTPRGHNHAESMYRLGARSPDWFAEISTVDDTGAIPEEILERELEEYISEHGKDLGEALFRQEYYCSFDAVYPGAYYASEIATARAQGRIGVVPYDDSLFVSTYWDLGVGDSTAIWFTQETGREIRHIDYYEASGVGIDHYADVLKAKPYKYEEHVAPHDIEVRELSTGKSRREIAFSKHGIRFTIAPRLSIEDGIQAVRDIFERCWFNEETTQRGIDALSQYHKEWDEKLKVFKLRPQHDWASNGADAFRYFAVSHGKQSKLFPNLKKRKNR